MGKVYTTRAAWRVPYASQLRKNSNVAHKWVGWLHHACRPGGLQSFTEGDTIRGGPQVGSEAT